MPRTRGRGARRGSTNFTKKRGRGRPRKNALVDVGSLEEDMDRQIEEQVMASQTSNKTPKKRGRKPNAVKQQLVEPEEDEEEIDEEEEMIEKEVILGGDESLNSSQLVALDEEQSCGIHVTTMQIKALAQLVACRDCGESVELSVRPTTKGMISEFVVACTVCEAKKVTITPNLVRERKRKREIKGLVLQKTENINYAHVASFLDNGLGYSGLRHYCKYFNARCLNEATFIVYARQVIQDVVNDTEDNLQLNARIVRKTFDANLDEILDITVSYTTTYHQWGSDFCLVAGAVIELQTGLVLDYDVANMYCHVCKINAKRIISMTPSEMTEWFNKHQSTCEIREWCDELDHDADEGVKDIEPKYLECFVAKKIWSRSVEKFGFRYSMLIHESDVTVHNELLAAAPYGDTLVMIDNVTNCFSRRKSEHARTAFQNKLKSKCPRERVQTKDRILYVYAMSIPEYNRFAIGSNIKLRELVRRMELEEMEENSHYSVQGLEGHQSTEIVPVEEADENIEMVGEEVITGDLEVTTIEGETINENQIDSRTEMEETEEEEEEEEEEKIEPKAKKIKLETATLVVNNNSNEGEGEVEVATENDTSVEEEELSTQQISEAMQEPASITLVENDGQTKNADKVRSNSIIVTKTVVASSSSSNSSNTPSTSKEKPVEVVSASVPTRVVESEEDTVASSKEKSSNGH